VLFLTDFACVSTFMPYFYDGFQIAVPHFLFIFNSDYGSIWLSFRDMGMGHTDDRQTNPLLKVSHLKRAI